MPIFKDNYRKYLSLGLTPFPASRNGKNPIEKWKDVAPTDELYSDWEKKYPNANIWLLLGNQFVVIDPDGPGAEEFVKSLNLPPCPTSISGNKSTHRWFKSPSPIKSLKIQNGSDQTFLEVRTGSMGMLAPPSIHPKTGSPYEWIDGHSPQDIPFPELPMKAYEKIKALQNRREPKMEPAQTENLSLEKLEVKRYLDFYKILYRIKTDEDSRRIIYNLTGGCLFADQHTTPEGQRDAAIIQGNDGVLCYYCFHSHCANKTWQDARRTISGDSPIIQFCEGYVSPDENKEQKQTEFLTRVKKAILSIDEIKAAKFPEKRKILNPWLSEQTLVEVVGSRGTGKTWFGLSICYAITRGINFGPWETVTPVPCLYVDGEMVIQDVQERIAAMDGFSGEVEKEPFIYLSDHFGNSLGLPKTNILDPKWREAIKQAALEWGVKVIVLDNISSLCPGLKENEKEAWDPVNQWLLDLRFNGMSVIFLHHTNKEGGPRGTTGREDNIDALIMLTLPPGYVPEDSCRFVLTFTKNRIKTADLPLIAETEFHLKETDGRLQWTFCETKKAKKNEVLRLLSEEVSQSEIAETLNLSKSRISQLKRELIQDGYLTKAGKPTIKGEALLNEG